MPTAQLRVVDIDSDKFMLFALVDLWLRPATKPVRYLLRGTRRVRRNINFASLFFAAAVPLSTAPSSIAIINLKPYVYHKHLTHT